MGTIHNLPEFHSSQPAHTTEEFLNTAGNLREDPSSTQEETIQKFQLYREGVLSLYNDWKEKYSNSADFNLTESGAIMAAWTALEEYMDAHDFSCSTGNTEGKQLFHIHYDAQWCLLTDILCSRFPKDRKLLWNTFQMHIPTHLKKPGISTIDYIKNYLSQAYEGKDSELSTIVEQWYITTSSLVTLYQDDIFGKKVQEMTQKNRTVYRDGLANSLNIATRLLRDLSIVSSNQIADAKTRMAKEQHLKQKVKDAISDLLII